MRYRAMAAIMAIISITCALRASADVPALYTAAQADEGGYIFSVMAPSSRACRRRRSRGQTFAARGGFAMRKTC
jgi:hypothetical protein